MIKRNKVSTLQQKAAKGEKLVMVTAYDYPMARMADAVGADIILIGDSLGNTVLGYDSTIQVTLADMLHHTRPVVRGSERAMVMMDLPYGSYHLGATQAVSNGIRAIQEGGAGAVKMEGNADFAPLVRELTRQGVPVMAHIGLLPQTASLWRGYRIQGRDEESACALLETAQLMEEAGAFSLLLECVTTETARLITEKVGIPTIGIGSGPFCSGQVLVFHDIVGISEGEQPKFVRRFAEGRAEMLRGLADYSAAVRSGEYPGPEHSYPMDEPDELKKLY